MGFQEGHIEEEKVFKGKAFPKVLLPSAKTKSSANDLVEAVEENKEWLTKTLQDHGAILIRGFTVASAEEYSAVIQALGWAEFCYEGPADRVKLAERVYTANAVPLHVTIPFHHEMARIRKHAPKIIFFCLQAPPEGGQTSIILSDLIVEKLEEKEPEAVRKLEEDGVVMVLHTRAAYQTDASDPAKGELVWQRMLKTSDEGEAEKRAMQMLAISSVKFNEDGSADFVFGPVNPVREINGKRVMFHSILPYEEAERSRYVRYGDGSPIPGEVADAMGEILDENSVDVGWREGDVMVVDNFAVQHARRPGKAPRKVKKWHRSKYSAIRGINVFLRIALPSVIMIWL